MSLPFWQNNLAPSVLKNIKNVLLETEKIPTLNSARLFFKGTAIFLVRNWISRQASLIAYSILRWQSKGSFHLVTTFFRPESEKIIFQVHIRIIIHCSLYPTVAVLQGILLDHRPSKGSWTVGSCSCRRQRENLHFFQKGTIQVLSDFKSELSVPFDRGKISQEKILQTNDSQYLEVWSDSGLEKVYNLGDLDLHGTVYFDSELGSMELNQSETILAYVAEKKMKKPESFFTQKIEKENIGEIW